MSPRQTLEALRRSVPAILPSLLMCDFGNLEREIGRLEQSGAAGLHLDVMDGHFVPNLTYGMPIVAAIRRLSRLPLDVHLMIAEPARYVGDFHEAGADLITFHVETVADARPVLEEIRRRGIAAGIAVNPDTPLSQIDGCLDLCDLVLIMSVPAGFGGQKFRVEAQERLRQVRARAGPDVLLEIDGGISDRNIGECARAGAQLFVVGSALFRQPAYESYISELRQRACAGAEES